MELTNEAVPYGWLQLARVVSAGVLLVAHEIGRIPPVRQFFGSVFRDTIPLDDIPEDVPDEEVKVKVAEYTQPSSIRYTLAFLSGLELTVWTVVFGSSLGLVLNTDGEDVAFKRNTKFAGAMVLVWLRLFSDFTLRRPVTIPWSALLTYLILCGTSFATLCVAASGRFVHGSLPAWATQGELVLEACNLVATLLLALIAGALRYNSPLTLARAGYVGKDDVVTFWQWMTFSWMNPFIAYASKNELQESDLPKLSRTMQTSIVFRKFKATKGAKLLYRIAKVNRLDLGIDITMTIISVIFNYLGPYFLRQILIGVAAKSNPTLSPEERKAGLAAAYTYALLALCSSLLKAGSDLIHLWHGRRQLIRIKAELISAIYNKALRRKDASGVISSKDKDDDDEEDDKDENKKANADTGKVVNLMSSDAGTVANTFGVAFMFFSSPIEVVVASVFLYSLLGWSAFSGIIVLVVAMPINTYLSKKSVKIYKEAMKARDKRLSVMNELIGAITFIKFFAWTDKWKKRVTDARTAELKQEVRSIVLGVFFGLVWALVPILVTLCSFFSYIVIAKQELTIAIAFTAIALFSMLQAPLNSIPTFWMWILQALVSVGRVEDFLGEEEVPDWVSSLKRQNERPTGPIKIAFEKATLRWNSGKKKAAENAEAATPASETSPEITEPSAADTTTVAPSSANSTKEVFELTGINVNFPLGKLTVITGPTGSGKTALLTALLGEMDLIEGETFLPKYPTDFDAPTGLRNSIAYAAQTPWLQQQSIKDNILFGEHFDEERYEAVVDACALRTDFDILEDGDETEIGAKGVSLSGGQKARVALARAVYSYTQHLLLDDPLAAVDSHTAKHLVDECLNGPLLRGRTVLLVSHHLDLLVSSADYIVRVVDGRIDSQGTPKELDQEGQLDGIVAVEEAIAAQEEPVQAEDVAEEIAEAEAEAAKPKKEKKKGPGRKLIKDEERAVGNVKSSTYMFYIRSATYLIWFIWAIVLIIEEAGSIGQSLWLKFWGEAYNQHVDTIKTFAHPGAIMTSSEFPMWHDLRGNFVHATPSSLVNSTSPAFVVQSVFDALPNPPASTHPGYYLAGYTIIVLVTGLIGVTSSIVGSWGSYLASKKIHEELLDSVLGGTVRFFNTTPLGRIINRFSKDIDTIDGGLGSMIRTMVSMIASLLARLFLVAAIVPGFIVPAAIISFLYFQYAIIYLRTGRSLRRLEATLRSPIFSGFSELLDGVISVRAFGAETRFFEKLCGQVDMSHSAHYYYWMTNRWLLLRFDLLGGLSVFATTILILRSQNASDGDAGVAITSAQGFVMSCYWLSRFWGDLEMSMNSVERVEEYLDIPKEPPAVIEGNRPPAYWPAFSENQAFIRAEDLEIKYAPELPTVFKGSFEIKAGEKIGLIGRTGSGKSTIAMSLLRFTDPASGRIFLDGIDITSIGVDDLRSRITYIPQDAVLFSGTVRDNLDPFNEHPDADLLDALARVRLITAEMTPARTPAETQQPPVHPRLVEVAAEHAAEERAKDEAAGNGNTVSTSATTAAATPRVQITLSSDVSAGGANFSQGQRQLVAMARALLRRSNLIIMDEATASVDFATDEAIQAAIRSEFKESTLLTIAHRLSSVIDYDRLLVLADGTVSEFDTPINLLRQDKSVFKSLAQKSGKFTELYRAAERKEREQLGEASSASAGASGAASVAEAAPSGSSTPPPTYTE